MDRNARGEQGTHTTRFKRGFARRHVSKIQAHVPREEYETYLANRSLVHAGGRRGALEKQGLYNHFDLVSGSHEAAQGAAGIRKGMAGVPFSHSYDSGFRSHSKNTATHPHAHTFGTKDDPGESLVLERLSEVRTDLAPRHDEV